MDFGKIISMLQGKTEPQLVRFVSDKGPNSCKACLEHHGKIFKQDDPNKPQLPIHPNCRCRYEEVKDFNTNAQLSRQNNSKTRQFLRNLPEATQTALEMKYLAASTGEIIGVTKAAALMVTEYRIWAARARTVVLASPKLTWPEKMNLCDKLANALAKNDIRTILIIHEKYK